MWSIIHLQQIHRTASLKKNTGMLGITPDPVNLHFETRAHFLANPSCESLQTAKFEKSCSTGILQLKVYVPLTLKVRHQSQEHLFTK